MWKEQKSNIALVLECTDALSPAYRLHVCRTDCAASTIVHLTEDEFDKLAKYDFPILGRDF